MQHNFYDTSYVISDKFHFDLIDRRIDEYVVFAF